MTKRTAPPDDLDSAPARGRGRPRTVGPKLLAHYLEESWCTHTTRETAELTGLDPARVSEGRKTLQAAGHIEVRRQPSAAYDGGRDLVYVSVNPIFRNLLKVSTKSNRDKEKRTKQVAEIREGGDEASSGLRVGDSRHEEAASARRDLVPEFLSYWNKRYSRAHKGVAYRRSPRDSNLAKKLTQQFEMPLLKQMVRNFFAMRGYGVPSISNFWMKRDKLFEDAREDIANRDWEKKEGERHESVRAELDRILSDEEEFIQRD